MLTKRERAIFATLRDEAPSGTCTLSLRRLANRVGCSVNTLRADLKRLAVTGYVEATAAGRYRTQFRVRDPIQQSQILELEQMRHTLQHSPYYGEALLKALLNLLIADIPYVDNARPSFLINPWTNQPLEYDRYYETYRVGIEFHGQQHDRLTALHADAASARMQRVRDLVKLGLSVEHQVTLLIFRPAQLSLEEMLTTLAGHLPLRDIDDDDPRLRLLESLCEEYRNRVVPTLKLKPAKGE